MPRDFLKCVADGGKVITKRVNSKQYIKVCYLNGTAHAGEVKNYKKLSTKK